MYSKVKLKTHFFQFMVLKDFHKKNSMCSGQFSSFQTTVNSVQNPVTSISTIRFCSDYKRRKANCSSPLNGEDLFNSLCLCPLYPKR